MKTLGPVLSAIGLIAVAACLADASKAAVRAKSGVPKTRNGLAHTETADMRKVRKALADRSGDDEWLRCTVEEITQWFGTCETVEEAVQVMESESIEPKHVNRRD